MEVKLQALEIYIYIPSLMIGAGTLLQFTEYESLIYVGYDAYRIIAKFILHSIYPYLPIRLT